MRGFAFAVVLLALGGTAEDASRKDEQKDCECVPYYLCERDPQDIGILDIPIVENECPSYLEVCCKQPMRVVRHPVKDPKKVCGIRNTEGIGFRITESDDNEALYGEFPWMVGVLKEETVTQREGEVNSIKTVNVYQCGGSLIHPSVVLTGAHCVSGENDAKFRIRAGEWDVQSKSELYPHQDRDVEKIVIHENFKKSSLVNDVALLFLSDPVVPEEHIGYACLPTQEYLTLPATRCFASGWGKDQFDKEGRYQTILKKVELPVVANPECQELLRKTKLGNPFKLDSSFMCAGGEEGKDTCRGDGGSPLVCPLKDHPNKYIQSGIVSWGIGCASETPGVYTNVALFRDWIDSKMALENYDSSYYAY